MHTFTVMYHRVGFTGRTLRVTVRAANEADALSQWGGLVPHGAHSPKVYSGLV